MSQSLIIFRASGKIEYQYNAKTTPFNEFIHTLVNETRVELDANFYTASLHQKRFYAYKRDSVYAALYFDAVTTLDSDKVKTTLQGILKTYNKLHEEENEDEAKLTKLVELQYNQLVKLKSADSPAPSSVVSSGVSTPIRKPGTPVPVKTPVSNKKMRKWDGDQISSASGNSKSLDYSATDEGAGFTGDTSQLLADDSAFVKENELVLVNELNDILGESDDEEEQTETPAKKGFLGKLTSYFGSTIDLTEVSKKFQDQLISKNIAPSTAKNIIDKIQKNFSSKKNITMAMYKQALTDELTKILTPNVSTDLLYDIKRNSSSAGRPYVISVVGVNGVGKSTNLAKLAFWFLQNNMSVLICACDTFRSGAVEQLKVHVNNLKNLTSEAGARIDIFEKGYGSGDHVVATAKSAIQLGSEQNYDIVLIDTAGRTHSNAKLMAPLKKFGDAANPDKIIMVGEALVGTDSVEQAINFNNAFGNRRSLDFFIISKVDTVGDLVGAMINMVEATKVPILFVGTGQTYTDIKRLSVNRVVEMLMS